MVPWCVLFKLRPPLAIFITCRKNIRPLTLHQPLFHPIILPAQQETWKGKRLLAIPIAISFQDQAVRGLPPSGDRVNSHCSLSKDRSHTNICFGVPKTRLTDLRKDTYIKLMWCPNVRISRHPNPTPTSVLVLHCKTLLKEGRCPSETPFHPGLLESFGNCHIRNDKTICNSARNNFRCKLLFNGYASNINIFLSTLIFSKLTYIKTHFESGTSTVHMKK